MNRRTRNIPALCAVALSLALTSPASSAPAPSAPASPAPSPLTLKRTDWQVVVPTWDPGIAADVKKTCDGGTLVATKADIDEREHNAVCMWTRLNCQIPLSCVRTTALSTTVSPVDGAILELSVYVAFGGEKSFALNRSRNNSPAAVRDPRGDELTAPQTPAPGSPANPGQTKPGQTKPGQTKPGTSKPPRSRPATPGSLTEAEEGWLTPIERTDYENAAGKQPAPSANDLRQLESRTRKLVENNLRDSARSKYKALIAGKIDPAKINAYLKTVLHYGGEEVELSAADQAALATVIKSTYGAGARLGGFANALLAYQAAMATVKDPSRQPDDYHVAAHRVVVEFKAMVPKSGTAPDPNAPPTKLSDADLAKLPKADQDAYNKEWAAAKNDDERRAVNKKYMDKIAAAAPDAPPSGSTATTSGPIDPSTIKTVDQFNLLTGEQKLKLCKPPLTRRSGGCGDVMSNASADATACNALKSPDGNPTATLKLRNACMEKADPCKDKGQPPPPPPPTALTPEVQKACDDFLANYQPDTNPNRSDISTPGPPAPGSDADDGDKKKDEGDKHLVKNIGNAVTFGIGGLILGSFFGGPLVMIAVAAVAAIGAYALSKKLNSKD